MLAMIAMVARHHDFTKVGGLGTVTGQNKARSILDIVKGSHLTGLL